MIKKIVLLSLFILISLFTAQAQLKGLLNKKKDDKKETDVPKNKAEKENINKNTIENEDVEPVSTEQIVSKKVAWEAKFDREINWFNLTSLGVVIVSTDDALYGIDPKSGQINWKNEQFKKLSKTNYTGLKGSPFIAIFDGGILSMKQTILDVTDGRIVCNTKDLGLKYANKRLSIPNLGSVLFGGMDSNGQALMLVSLIDGKKQWSVNKVFEKASEQLVAEPLLTSKGIMIATSQRIYMLDRTNGGVIYKIDYPTKVEIPLTGERPQSDDKESTLANAPKKAGALGTLASLGGLGGLKSIGGGEMKDQLATAMATVYAKFITVDDKIAYFYNSQTITGIDINSGSIVWPKTKLEDPIANVLFDENGILVATDDKKSELMLFDYQNGTMKWSQPLKLSGRISSIKLTGTKLSVGSAKQNGRNLVNIVDIVTGKSASNSALKVDGFITDLRMIENVGLLYRTTEETNIQDINTGKDVWAKSIKYKTGGLGVDKGDLTYFTADNNIYEINSKTGEHRVLAAQKFGNKEVVNAIELRENGILISSDQNAALFDLDGKNLYHSYYAAPGASVFSKIVSGVAMAVSVGNSAAEGYQAGVSGYGTTSYNDHMAKADRWGGIGSAALGTFSQRFNASDNAKNYILMLTRVKSAGDNGIGLVRVNKINGKIEGKVVIDDKEPDYLFDEVDNILFYRDSNKKIVAYNFMN